MTRFPWSICAASVAACVGAAPTPTAPVLHPPTPITAPGAPELRLPSGGRPTGYAVDIKLDPGDPVFRGVVDVGVELAPESRTLWLHGKALAVSEATLTVNDEKMVTTVTPVGDLLRFDFGEQTVSGAATLHIVYQGKVDDRDSGLYLQKNGGDRYLFTQFEETDARRMVPCFDEPNYKVPWQLTVHAPANSVVVSNTRIVNETDEPGGQRRTTFAQTPPLPSYLLALAVGPLEAVEAGAAGRNRTPLRVWVPRGRSAQGRFMASIAPELLQRLESYFDIPFPYDKLDNLARPDGGGAMENAGLIITGATYIIADKESDEFREYAASVAAHEMAHQWFGDLVTMAWWDDIWLNEAFATWLGQKVYAVRREWQPEVMNAQDRYKAMAADALAGARQIRQPIRSADDIADAFDSITYEKGASVLAMFEAAIGADKFQRGVHDYIAEHAHKNATTADFLRALSNAAGRELAPAFATFLEQPGLPLVTIKPSCNRIAVEQARYRPAGSKAKPGTPWEIPVCVKIGQGRKVRVTCTTLKGAATEIAVEGCPDWVFGNAGAHGYYTAAYDAEWFAKLVGAADRLELAEQLALVADMRLQVVGGHLPADRALEAIARLARSSGPDVIAALTAIIDDFSDRGLVPAAQAGPFAAWIQRTFGARARALGWRAKDDETPAQRRLRVQLLPMVALHGRDLPLRDEAKLLVTRWLEDRSAVPADIVPSALHVAAWTGGESLLARVRAAVPKAEGYDRQLLLETLLDFNDADLLPRAAQSLVDDFEARDFRYLKSLEATGAARPALFRFVREHYDVLATKLGADGAAALIGAGRPLCDAASLEEFQQFFADRAPRVIGGPRSYALMTEGIELCIAARALQNGYMASYLKGQ